MSASEIESVSRRAVSGAKWLAVWSIAYRSIQFIAVLVLARILSPGDFGVFAIATAVVSAVSAFKELGMPSAIIQRRERVQASAGTFFYLSWTVSAVAYAAIFAGAPYLAWYTHEEAVTSVLRVAAIQIFIQSSSIAQQTLAVRALRFRRQVFINLAESITTGGVSIILASRGMGVWALVLGSLAGPAISALLWIATYRPRIEWRFERAIAAELLGFGGRLSAAYLLDSALDACGRTFVGRYSGAAPLGHFDLSARLATMPFRAVVYFVGQRVTLPALCHVQDDLVKLGQWYMKSIRYTCLLTAPVALSLLLAAGDIVPALFGANWIPSIPAVRATAVQAVLLPLVYALPAYVSTGRVPTLLRFSLARFLVSVPCLFAAAHAGMLQVCITQSALLVVFAVFNLRLLGRILEISTGEVLGSLTPLLSSAFFFALTTLAAGWICDRLELGVSVVRVGLVIGPSLVAYLLSIRLFHPGVAREISQAFGFQGANS